MATATELSLTAYFDHPLPEAIAELRAGFYRHLAPIANEWSTRLRGEHETFPATHEGLLERCHSAGQQRPTGIIFHDAK